MVWIYNKKKSLSKPTNWAFFYINIPANSRDLGVSLLIFIFSPACRFFHFFSWYFTHLVKSKICFKKLIFPLVESPLLIWLFSRPWSRNSRMLVSFVLCIAERFSLRIAENQPFLLTVTLRDRRIAVGWDVFQYGSVFFS